MPFCSNCGNELSPGTKFCNACGSPQAVESKTCPNCGNALEENEKFCSSCGNPVGDVTKSQSSQQPDPKQTEEGFTKEGKKIISGSPKTPQNSQAAKIPPPIPQPKKKKRGCFGCFFRTVLILLIIIIVVVGVKFVLSKINNSSGKSGNPISEIKPGKEIVTSVPGGDNIKKEDKPFESEDLKQTLNELETILENADLEKLKSLLSDSALLKYEDELDKLKPRLAEYAKAFKKRKPVVSTDFFKTYEFSDSAGNKYTLTLEFQPGETWKITQL